VTTQTFCSTTRPSSPPIIEMTSVERHIQFSSRVSSSLASGVQCARQAAEAQNTSNMTLT
jgi:hypothetical protein